MLTRLIKDNNISEDFRAIMMIDIDKTLAESSKMIETARKFYDKNKVEYAHSLIDEAIEALHRIRG